MDRTQSILNTETTLPFLLNGLDSELGATLPTGSQEWVYTPSSQRTNMLEIIEQEEASKADISCTGFLGDTSPTTTSSVAGTTGIINTDSDESNDDEGTD